MEKHTHISIGIELPFSEVKTVFTYDCGDDHQCAQFSGTVEEDGTNKTKVQK